MDSLVSASSLLERQPPPASSFLPFPHPTTAPSGNPTTLSLPPLPSSFSPSFTASHSLTPSLNPTRGPNSGFRRTLGQPSPQPTGFDRSPFAGLPFSTSSHLARRDGPLLSPSQRSGSDPSVSITVGRRTTDTNNPTPALTTPFSHPQSLRQQTYLSRQSANTPQFGLPNLPISSDSHHNSFRQAYPQEPNSDDFLEALATGRFSSPSLPPYSPQRPPQPQPHRETPFADFPNSISTSRPRPLPAFSTYFPPAHGIPEREGDSVDLPEVDLEEQGDGSRSGHDDNEKITVDSLLLEMPATRAKRSRAAASPDASLDGPSTIKRQRTGPVRRTTPGRPASSRGQKPRLQHAFTIPDSDDLESLFGNAEDDIEVFDLTKSEDGVPEELMKPKEDNSIKLSKFECIICMDAANNLTVTHCGHMFCAQCLHQAMHTEVTKKVCPMCRQKLEPRPKDGRQPNAKAKTFFQLELKLMPSKRQGKQPARR
ncbi:hypothetical protein VSDG_08240 [Cytospora chrysosperma]|uniref:RING-type domain-containing protein n=1 Tax=Cytospora chrysosperma TaxID=252740 RepID=A0A423VFY5_CYTCH|nr:hypothetical protein VSDG_08240 [Valsa sordida]